MKSSVNKEKSTRKPGNPEFGKKWKFESKGDQPLTDQILVRLTKDTKEELVILAKKQNKSLAEIARRAIANYLEQESNSGS